MSDASELEAKPWYQRPENVLVYGVLGLLGWYAVQSLDVILPVLNRVLENMIYTGVLFGTLAILGFLAVNGDFHKLAWYGYTSAMRWVTNLFVTIDPIGMMKNAVKRLRAKLSEIKKATADMRSQERELEKLVKTKTEAHDKSMNLASEARKRKMDLQVTLQGRKAMRAEKSITTYQGLLNEIRKNRARMEKIAEVSECMIADMEDTIADRAEQRKAIGKSYRAMKAAQTILGASKEREMFDLATEADANDYFSKVGQIEQFYDESQKFVDTMDLENGVYDTQAVASLDEWEKNRLTGLLEGGTGKTKYRVTPLSADAAPEDEEDDGVTEKRQSVADIFSKLDQ